MSVEIISQDGCELTLQIKVDLSGSMLNIEDKIQTACNEAGLVSTEVALQRFDTGGSDIVVGGTKYTARTQDNQVYQTPYGAAKIKRYVYQTSEGGKVFCPLESAARIIHDATPRFAKVLSHKYSNMSGNDSVNDLRVNHGRKISKDYLQKIAVMVGDIIASKEERWEYSLPRFATKITTASISMDGAHLLMHKEGWREGMVGTISFYNKAGNRQHTIYVGCPPEYGKTTFMNRLEQEIEQIKKLYPEVLYLGIADGAKDNWPYLEKHTDKQLLDFYHVTEYLAKVSYAAYPEKTGKPKRIAWLNERCHQLKHKRDSPKAILKELKRFTRKRKLSRIVREDLESTITYFKNNLHRMNYAEHIKKKFPIGSGVTEAACKTLIKQRLCCSGMRWKNRGVKMVLKLRELIQTAGRWQQFWDKINQYGVPNMA
jgi:hypothetical protein